MLWGLLTTSPPVMILDSFARAEQIAREFSVSSRHLRDATPLFVRQLRDGLEKDDTALLQVPSYVTTLPNGKEKGTCLAIDLGGTNLRVLKVRFNGDSTYSLEQTRVVVPPEVLTADTHTTLFGFIANQTHSFLLEHLPEELERAGKQCQQDSEPDNSQHQPQSRISRQEKLASADIRLPVSFTFSFSFSQCAINKGSLLFWSKAFNIQDAVGRDPCVMLQEALDERQLPLKVSALVNDTTGVLAARAYCQGRTCPSVPGPLLGAVFGTGTNGAYMERIESITKLPKTSGEHDDDTVGRGSMAINTEWGGFDDDMQVLPRTVFDDDLDRDSVNPQTQYYEKRISGLYLGELWRLAMLSLVEKGDQSKPSWGKLFSILVPRDSALYIPYSIDSSLLSVLVQDTSFTLRRARERVAQILGTRQGPSRRETRAMRSVAEAIGRRAARLSAVAIAGIVIQSGRIITPAGPKQPPPPPQEKCAKGVQHGTFPLDEADLFSPAVTSTSPEAASLTAVDSSSSAASHREAPRFTWEALRCCLCFPVLFCASVHSLFLPSRRARSRSRSISERIAVEEHDVIDIGVDGSLYEHYPCFERELRAALREIPEIGAEVESRIAMSLVRDGSGVGAAIIALLYA